MNPNLPSYIPPSLKGINPKEPIKHKKSWWQFFKSIFTTYHDSEVLDDTFIESNLLQESCSEKFDFSKPSDVDRYEI